MKLLLVMLLVSGLLIGESRAQRPIVKFFSNLYLNLRNSIRNVVGISTTSTTISSTITPTTVTIAPPPDITEDEPYEEISIDFPILINSQLEMMDTAPSAEFELSTTTESGSELITEISLETTTEEIVKKNTSIVMDVVADLPDLSTVNTELDLSTINTEQDLSTTNTELDLSTVNTQLDLSTVNTELELPTVNTELELPTVNTELELPTVNTELELPTMNPELELSTINPQVDLTTPFPQEDSTENEMNTEMPELDPVNISAMQAMVETLLQIPTTTVASPTTQDDIPDTTETEPTIVINVKVVQPVKVVPAQTPSTTISTVQSIRTSTKFSSLAPKRTIHFSRPSWTPTFLKLANRNTGPSRYFFPAHFRRPKGEDVEVDVQEDSNFLLEPSRVLPVESSIGPRMPYVVKRHVKIESSLRASHQQQSKSMLDATAKTY